MSAGEVVLETERLLLRRLVADDAPFLLELLNDPDFLLFVGDKGVRTLEDARRYVEEGPARMYAQHGFGLYRVELRRDGTPIGMCGLLKRDSLEDVDVGFAFLPPYRGQGYARESAAAVMAYGCSVLGVGRIVAITHPDNRASAALLEKLGLRFEKMIRMPEIAGESRLFVPRTP